MENVTCACLTGRRQNVGFLKVRDDAVLSGNLLPTFRKRLVPPNNLQFCNVRQHCGERQTLDVLKPICIRWDPVSNISLQTDYSEAAATATLMPESYSIWSGDHVTVVAAVTGLRARRSGVWISEQQEIFLFSKAYGLALGPTQTPVKRVLAFFPRGEEAGAWSSPLTLSSTDVKNEWSCTSYSTSMPSWCWRCWQKQRYILSALPFHCHKIRSCVFEATDSIVK